MGAGVARRALGISADLTPLRGEGKEQLGTSHPCQWSGSGGGHCQKSPIRQEVCSCAALGSEDGSKGHLGLGLVTLYTGLLRPGGRGSCQG